MIAFVDSCENELQRVEFHFIDFFVCSSFIHSVSFIVLRV